MGYKNLLVRLVITMSAYKYFVVSLMLILFIYSLFLDTSYPFMNHANFADIERIQKEVANIKTEDIIPSNWCTIYNLTPNYKADFECVKTRTHPAATVCLYPPFMDTFISHDIRETGIWEPQLLGDFFEVLNKDESLGLLDIGANIGYFTMLAAASDRKILAMEPNINSIYKIHRAAVLTNSTSRITVLQNAVSDIRTQGTLYGGGENKGDVRVHPDTMPCRGSCPSVVRIIYLDDILSALTFDRAVLKLDIQGDEHKAMSHAEKLLSQVYIPVIFMEWGLMATYYLPGVETSSDEFMVEDMIRILFKHDYRPYQLSSDGGKPLDIAVWNKWPHDIIWRKLANEEEIEGAMRNHFMNWP